jgi:hypothetical protein
MIILGAGGTKPRPDIGKQRSISNAASPTHSRTPSNASDTAIYMRSSDVDNFIADPTEILEQLKGKGNLTIIN